jgi:hypothetical protein
MCFAAALVAVAGCAPNLVKEGVTQEEADRDWAQCRSLAGDSYAKAEECMVERGWKPGY